MNIAFFDNGNLSKLYGEIAIRLKEKGHNVYIICLSRNKEKLFNNQYNVNTILVETRTDKYDEIGYQILSNLERDYDFTLNKAILLDRIIRKWSFEKALNYLSSFSNSLYSNLCNKEIDLIFGEITWGIEYITYYLMLYNNKKYLNPINTSVIPGRFVFLDNENSDIFMKKEPNKKEIYEASAIIDERLSKDINDNVLFLKMKKPPNLVKRIYSYVSLYDKNDYRYSIIYKKEILKKYLNRFKINVLKNKLFTDIDRTRVLKKNMVLLALHVQPEATPDVISPEYSNQLELAKNIARNLPSDYILLIKEHPNGVGSRSISELKKFKEIPNSYLINPYIPTNKIAKEVEAVFTIAGTISFESSLHGIKSFIFSNVYYKAFPNVNKIDNYKDIKYMLASEIVSKDNNYSLAKVYTNSYKGNIYDPFLMPNVLDKENIDNLVISFLSFINIYEEQYNEN